MGEEGVIYFSRKTEKDTLGVHRFPAATDVIVRNATGAGDSFTGALIHTLLLLQPQSPDGGDMEIAIKAGMTAAVASLECADHAISPTIGREEVSK